ncbi:hypothetical protein D3C84_1286920 [compost metagenome]
MRLAAQSYGRAQQFDKRNAGIAPKLALLREVFLPKPPAATEPPPAEEDTDSPPADDTGVPASDSPLR